MKRGAYGFKTTMLEFSLNSESNEVLALVEDDFDRLASKILSEGDNISVNKRLAKSILNSKLVREPCTKHRFRRIRDG